MIDNADQVYSKIIDLVKAQAEQNGKIMAYIEVTERKIPDKNEIEEIKRSIGKSDQSLVALVENFKQLPGRGACDGRCIPVVRENGCNGECAEKIEKKLTDCIGKMEPRLSTAIEYMDQLSKGAYSEDDLSELGKAVSDINKIAQFVEFIKIKGAIIAGAITLVLSTLAFSDKIAKLIHVCKG